MKVSIYGLGYIGLPTAALISSKKLKVLGIDTNKLVVENINKGLTHIREKNLSTLVAKAVKNKFLLATTTAQAADVHIITVPTPINKNQEADLSYVNKVILSISTILKKGDLIIIESTSPVGTTEKISMQLKKLRPEFIFPKSEDNKVPDINIVYCPERVLPGNILYELKNNNRILGGVTKHCSLKAKKFFSKFVSGKLFITNSRLAEMAKLTENSFRDVNIAFANEISQICDKFKINVWDLIKLANEHPRVNILEPGPGVGGHCIAVDPWFLVQSSKPNAQLIKKSRIINDRRPKYIYNKILKEIKKQNLDISKLNICFLGVTFKADVEDIRTSPALEIVKAFEKLNFKNILVVEPNLTSNRKGLFKKAKFLSQNEAIQKCQVIVLLVAHKEFKKIRLNSLKDKILIDTKGFIS